MRCVFGATRRSVVSVFRRARTTTDGRAPCDAERFRLESPAAKREQPADFSPLSGASAP